MAIDLSQYVSAQRAKGLTDEQIKQQLEGLASSEEINQALGSPTLTPVAKQAVPATEAHHLNGPLVLLTLGIVFILVAYIFILFSAWPDLTHLMRFVVIAAPNALLLLISFFTRKRAEWQKIDSATCAFGLALLPITTGTFLYQFGFQTDLEPQLFLLATSISLPLLLLADYLRKQTFTAALAMLNLTMAFFFLGSYLKWSELVGSSVEIIGGLIALALSIYALTENDERHGRSYQALSAVLLVFGLPSLLGKLLNYEIWDQNGDLLIIFAVINGVVGLAIASLYGWLFVKRTHNELVIQRFLQLLATLGLVFLPIFAFASNDQILILPTLIVSLLVLIFGLLVGVRLIFSLGIVGVFMTLLIFLFKEASGLGSTIVLLTLGFVAIALSIILSRVKLAATKALYSASLAKNLGIISDEEAEGLSDRAANRRISWGRIALLLLLVFTIVPMILSFAYSRQALESQPPIYQNYTCSSSCQLGNVSFSVPSGWSGIGEKGATQLYVNYTDYSSTAASPRQQATLTVTEEDLGDGQSSQDYYNQPSQTDYFPPETTEDFTTESGWQGQLLTADNSADRSSFTLILIDQRTAYHFYLSSYYLPEAQAKAQFMGIVATARLVSD